ncbi:YdeI/OmpD-associated family protein [Polaribacter sp.]|uniref:YdeI/OmpD-associated family protein n=1 Tax=Polaribacter sp. TaxID=1920175 RepID=UPI0040480B91
MSDKVLEYIEKQSKWKDILMILREILHEFPLEETIKWGAPVYVFNQKNCVGLAAFKNYCALWFFQGALINDKKKVFFNAQEGKTKAMLQWRFFSTNDIQKELIKQYITQAIENIKLGKEINRKMEDSSINIPIELQSEFSKNKDLAIAFLQLSKSCQREYAMYISDAKKSETRVKRVEKCIAMILAKKGLNDQYKKN